MFLLKYFFGIVLIISTSLSQGYFNGYGVGDTQNWTSASVSGASSIGLVPSYRNNISLSNPTTWSNLKFTFLSISLTITNFNKWFLWCHNFNFARSTPTGATRPSSKRPNTFAELWSSRSPTTNSCPWFLVSKDVSHKLNETGLNKILQRCENKLNLPSSGRDVMEKHNLMLLKDGYVKGKKFLNYQSQ